MVTNPREQEQPPGLASASLPCSPTTGAPQPETERRAQRRLAIVEAAARLFADAGYTACEMDRVAAEVGVAKGTLYLYYPGKQELFFACVDLGMRQMQQAVRQATEGDDDPFVRISRAIGAYLEFFDQHAHYVELLIQERAIFKDRKRPTYFEYRDANRGVWREFYSQLVEQGRLRADVPVERILDTIGNLLYGTMFTNQFIGRTVTIDEQRESLVQIIFRGILSDSERAR